MKPRHLVPLIGFVVLAALLGAGLGLRPREVPSPFIDKPAPHFTLPTLHDPSRHVAPADLRGQVWVLNVWASWCAPCRDEHPVIVQAAGQGGVAFLGLNYKDDPRNAQEWLLRLGNPYRASLSDRDGRVGIDYGVYGVPETFVIDKQGVIRFKHIGPVTTDVWSLQMLPLIRKLEG
jgi:cytochrome c biogenesis protein CcmG/thiol:disulfide interchange protein DsbE